MALSKEAAGLETGSDAEKENVCAACMDVGDYRQAVKYCIDCAHLVCQNCVDCHRRFKQMKEHKLVDISKDEDLKLSQVMSSLLICPSHPDKTVELVCKNHDVLCCLTCATVSHRGCSHVVEVASETMDPKQSSTTDTLKKHLTAAKGHMTSIVKQHEKSKAEFIATTDVLIPKKLKELKQNLMRTFTVLEQGILTETTKQRVSHVAKHDEEIAKWAKYISSINEAFNLLSSAHQNGSSTHVYVVLKKLQKTLNDVDMAIADQGNKLSSEIISLKEGSVSVLRSKPCSLADLCVTKTTATLPEYKFAHVVGLIRTKIGILKYLAFMVTLF